MKTKTMATDIRGIADSVLQTKSGYDISNIQDPNSDPTKIPGSATSVEVVNVYLAHEQNGVEYDEEHDEVLEGRRGDEAPDMVAEPGLALWNVHLLRLRLYHVRDTRFLKIQY